MFPVNFVTDVPGCTRPINLAFVAPSATGKNRTVDAALALVPSTAYYLERAGSERALIYVEALRRRSAVRFSEFSEAIGEAEAFAKVRAVTIILRAIREPPDAGPPVSRRRPR